MTILLTSPNIIELERLKAYLDEIDVVSRIDEIRNAYISANGSVYEYRLSVSEDDAQRARIVLAKFRAEAAKSRPRPWCPDCGGEEVEETVVKHRYGSVGFIVATVILLMAGVALWMSGLVNVTLTYGFFAGALICLVQFFVGYKENVYRCNKCGHIFNRY